MPASIETTIDLEPTATTMTRRHDLDALRAVAMLLGVLIHAVLPYVPWGGAIWGIQDPSTTAWLAPITEWIHGFRMPLFFIISGYFTAMLLRRRGPAKLVWHRFQRIFIPLVLGLITLVPLNFVVLTFASAMTKRGEDTEAQRTADDTASPTSNQLWSSAMFGTLDELIDTLTEGANPNSRLNDGSTVLHSTILFGRYAATKQLLDAGGDPMIRSNAGHKAWESLHADEAVTRWISNLTGVAFEPNRIARGRIQIANLLASRHPKIDISDYKPPFGLPSNQSKTTPAKTGEDSLVEDQSRSTEAFDEQDNTEEQNKKSEAAQFLTEFPLMQHLWFLNFLCYLVIGFVIVDRCVGSKLAGPWVYSRTRLAVLVPVVVGMFFWSKPALQSFGPETSATLIPRFSCVMFYAVFFGFGALMYDDRRFARPPGRWSGVGMLFSIAVLWPISLVLKEQAFVGVRLLDYTVEALYAWLFSFSMMAFFERHVHAERSVIRYLSDASYWIYLVHIPVVVLLVVVAYDWQVPAIIKLTFVSVIAFIVLTISYHLFVRFTPIGWLLNGRRHRLLASSGRSG
ncbi:MAG: acyltransferase family protein [Planctomycetota bacterium]